MPEAIPESVNWNFTKETTKAGLTYIKAYKTRWFPELKTSKRVMRRHVGRLLDDDQIVISEKFIADHPEYANGPWYWGIDKRPVSYDEYRRQFPEKPGVPPVDEDDTEPQPTLSIGLTWAAVEFARNHGILAPDVVSHHRGAAGQFENGQIKQFFAQLLSENLLKMRQDAVVTGKFHSSPS